MFGITPNGKQVEVLALPATGHITVLGTAGSGKTTIALLRAIQLANFPGNQKVLLVTFNGALVQYIRSMSNYNSSGITIENYHKFARGYLNSRGKMPSWNGILDPDGKEYFIQQAVDYYQKLNFLESTFKRPISFFIDEITFIQKFGFTSFADYYNAERIGRGSANIRRDNRKWIYDVYEKYLELRNTQYDWDDLAFHVYHELQADTTPRRYNHIIVDEGQDFSPMMINSLVNAVAPKGSFTFFGDVAQQIYGSRLSWRHSGINADKIWRFEANYRNPAIITNFANDITRSKYWQQNSDMVKPSIQIAEGPNPILVKFENMTKEMNWIVQRAISNASTSSNVIICRNREHVDLFMRIFNSKGYLATEIDKNTPGFAHMRTIYLTTFHAAKGLEFDNVYIPFLSEDIFPDRETIEKARTEEDAYADEIKLFYVAVTRSKYGLYMSYHGTLSSLFPVNSKNYDLY